MKIFYFLSTVLVFSLATYMAFRFGAPEVVEVSEEKTAPQVVEKTMPEKLISSPNSYTDRHFRAVKEGGYSRESFKNRNFDHNGEPMLPAGDYYKHTWSKRDHGVREFLEY